MRLCLDLGLWVSQLGVAALVGSLSTIVLIAIIGSRHRG